MTNLCDVYFGRFRASRLHEEIWFVFLKYSANMSVAVKHLLDEAANKTREELRIQCEMETRYPFTMNEQYLMRAQAAKHKEILLALKQTPGPTDVQEVMKKLADLLGVPVQSAEEFLLELGSGKYSKEFHVISGALAYFQVASQRMIDVIPMRIEQHLIYDFAESVKKLDEILGLVGEGGEKRCKEFMVEDPKVHIERKEFQEQKDILVKASEILGTI